MEKIKKKIKPMMIIGIIAILLVPSLYCFTYLKAFWDPYSKFSNVPVAFVNLDKSVVKNGKEYAIGKDLEKNLKNNDSVKWKFVSYDEGKRGLEDSNYYAMIVIPENFSYDIANGAAGELNRPEIEYYTNEAKNFIFAQVSQRVVEGIKNNIEANISKEVSKELVITIEKMKDSIGNVASGSKAINDGIYKLKYGSDKLLDGENKLINGLNLFKDNLSKGSSDAYKLVDASNKLAEGSKNLSNSMKDLNNGTSRLKDGIGKITEKASEGNIKMNESLNKASKALDNISDGLDKAYRLIESSEKNISTGKATEEDYKNLNIGLAILKNINDSNIKENIADKLKNNENSLEPLVKGLNNLNSAANTISDGTNKASNGADKISSGMGQLVEGNKKLVDGIEKSQEKAKDAVTKLLDGSNDLKNGISSLNSGLAKAYDGSNKLSNGLSDGYEKLDKNINFTPDSMSEFISNPINVDEKIINNVPVYGEGLAPYFMSLGMWIGSMFVFQLIIAIQKKFKGDFKARYIKRYLIGVFLNILQASILTVVLKICLGMSSVSSIKFWLSNILVSIVMYTFINGTAYILGGLMRGAIIVMLLLQLSSCGGTFPIQTAPAFYRIIGNYLPMTYTVDLLKMTISGINTVRFNKDIKAIIIFIIVFIVVGFIGAFVRNSIKVYKKNKEKVSSTV